MRFVFSSIYITQGVINLCGWSVQRTHCTLFTRLAQKASSLDIYFLLYAKGVLDFKPIA